MNVSGQGREVMFTYGVAPGGTSHHFGGRGVMCYIYYMNVSIVRLLLHDFCIERHLRVQFILLDFSGNVPGVIITIVLE